MRGSLFVLWMMMSCFVVQAQENAWLKEWMELNPEVMLDEDAMQNMLEWMQEKRDINKVVAEELSLLPFMDDALAKSIIAHRERSGAYHSLLELQVISGMRKETYHVLIQVLSVKPSNAKQVKQGKSEYIGLFQLHNAQKRGYQESVYSGAPLRQWHRWKFQVHPNWKLGLSLENDAGESFRWNARQKGFDFGTCYLHYTGNSNWQMIFGDYRLKTGQGLLLGLGNNFGSSTWVGRVFSNDGARPYRGSDENLFLRGIYLQKNWQNWQWAVFASRLRSDGRVVEAVISESGTGLHRSENELALRKQFTRAVLGAEVKYRWKHGELGLTSMYLNENGRANPSMSLFYQTRWKQLLFFGEGAYGASGLSLLQSVVFSVNGQLDFSALFRAYPRENLNPYAGGFSRFSANENERGLYVSAEYQTPSRQKWKFFADWAYRPYPSFLLSHAYWAKQVFLETEKRLGSGLFQFRLQWKAGEKELAIEQVAWKQSQHWQSVGIRIHASWNLSESWVLSTRLQQEHYQLAERRERGTLFFQDLQWRPKAAKYYVLFRYSRFVIPSYDTRIYAYESDVLYAFSIPSYSGAGQRVYAVLRFPIFHGMDAWLKAGYIWYFSKTSIGSQWEEVESNQQMDLKFLLRYTF